MRPRIALIVLKAGALLALGLALLATARAESPLVSAEWLAAQLPRGELVLLDASPAALHRKQHIPGAVNVDVWLFGAREETPAQAEQRLRSWGVSAGKTIVVYDAGGAYMAPLAYFDLLLRGLPPERVRLLDGGLARWKAIGGALTDQPTPAPAPGTITVGRPREELRVRLPEFLAATADPAGSAVVDALEPQWHFGETGFFDRKGHVPQALMLPANELFNADKTFKSPAELRRMAAHLGIRPDQKVYTYCGGGGAAAVPFFALRYLLGYPDVKLYQGSQYEWLSDPRGLPMWSYSQPALMRDPAWLKGWGGTLLRSVGMGRVSVIDVRPAADYALAHLPFALGLPAERLAPLVDQPARLGELLGNAGVDPAHEAVIVSEGGLDERAALAYFALWRAGQRQVSILMASTEQWAALGYGVATEPTRVGERRTPAEQVVPAARYTPQPRENRARADAASAAPVYVASGARLPERPPAGTVVHLPYTQLLGKDGQPRPAAEIFNAIAKAGVPRYTPVVLVADALGEAAANHYLFRLVGFSDVTVQLP